MRAMYSSLSIKLRKHFCDKKHVFLLELKHDKSLLKHQIVKLEQTDLELWFDNFKDI